MSTLYALFVRPNWKASFAPAYLDLTSTVGLDQLPTIAITVERSDTPLVATTSDLTLTVQNDGGEWDAVFDAAKVVGTLPPVAGESIRAPAAHYGKLLFCRKSTNKPGSKWHVLFAGFIDAVSPRFDRASRTCTFTAYACGRLLEAGNAERVHRFHAFVEARPYVLTIDLSTGAGAIQHPVPPNGVYNDADGNGVPADNSWWRLLYGATRAIPLQSGDQFQVVRAVADDAWVEGMETVQIVNQQFSITQVVAQGVDLFFQTVEVSSDAALVLAGHTASIELVNPWYRSRDWRALIDGSDGNTNCLKTEANDALALLDVPDTVAFSIDDAPTLPLLRATSQLFALPIYQPDVVPGVAGVAYGRYSGTPFLAHQRYTPAGLSPVTAKPDVLAADSVAGVFAPFAGSPPGRAKTAFFNPAIGGGQLNGPDYGKSVRLLSSSINDRVAGQDPPDFATNDLPLAGQDRHEFKAPDVATISGGVSSQTYDSTHWCRAPSSYRSGSEPKRYYQIYARGRYVGGTHVYRKGIQIAAFTTGDEGTTWTLVATANNAVSSSYPDDSNAYPNESRSSRPSLKVFELDATHFLYVWVDPIKAAAFCYESANDTVAPATLLAASPFVAGGASSSPVLSSSAVHWPGVTLFFADRADLSGVDVYSYAAGPTWTPVTIVDDSGLGIPKTLIGADWINAVVDDSRSPARLYVMVGKILYALHVAFAGSTLTISAAQAITIDQVNFDLNVESVSESQSNTGATAWLACPVTQAVTGGPDYTASSDALIVGTLNAVYIVSNVASNLVDVADFTGLSVAAALSKLILLRAYFMLTGSETGFVTTPVGYDFVPTVSFYARLETIARLTARGEAPIDLVKLTETIEKGTFIQNYNAVLVGNSRRTLGPAPSSSTLTTLDGDTFTITEPRNPGSSALQLDIPFIETISFAALLANLYAPEFVIPRALANVATRSLFAQGVEDVELLPGRLATYLAEPPDSLNHAAEAIGRILSVSYGLADELDALEIA